MRWLLAILICGVAASAVPVGVVNDRAPDTTSLETMVASVTRGCRTDDERAVAIYNYLRYALYHHAYPGESGGGIGALKLINVYGWSLCGGEHSVLAALYEKAGWPWRYRGWSNPGHTTVEANYGGRWHWLDVFLKFYCWRPDAEAPGGYTITSQEDIIAQPALLDGYDLDATRRVVYHRDGPADWTAPAYLVCGDDVPGLLQGLRSSNNAGSPRGWNSINFDEPGYSAVPELGPGMSLRLDWDRVDGGAVGAEAAPAHSCGDKDYRWCPAIGPLLEPYRAQRAAQSWSNGTFAFDPDLRTERCLASFAARDNLVWRAGRLQPDDVTRPATAIVRVTLPYPLVEVKPAAAAGYRLEVSADGQAWQAAGRGLSGRYAWQARFTLTEPVAVLGLSAVVQHNQRALPYLAPGRNRLTISGGGDLAGRRVAVSLAWLPGSRSRSLQKLADRDEELGKGHGATWATEPVIARAVVDRLPATLTIDVPTPAGAEPVYPRMLWLRREVLDAAELASGDRLAPEGARLPELPNPWTMGNRPPVPRAAGPVKTLTLPFETRAVVSADGQRLDNGPLRWPKAANEQVMSWAWLLGRPTGALPPADQILTARIAFEVTDCHDKADTMVGAVTLGSQLKPGERFDFAGLGNVVGSTVLKRATGPVPFDPPRACAIDVTRAVRAMARDGGAGFALRVVPNRAVDDGWTVRFTPRADTAPKLIIELPAAKPAE